MQIYFHIWLKISVKINISLLGNELLSLDNLYAQVTKKWPIFYRYKSIGLVYLIYMVDHGKITILGIYENIKLGLINFTLLGLIEHHGVFINSGHYVSYIRQNNMWYHCDDKHITETSLLTLSNNIYLMFYAKEIDIGT